jgi:Protein of unknown function (DUF4058)
MASPFPGMNPYLEFPAFWSEFHNRMMVAIADDLSPQLRPHYRVAIEQRVYLSSIDSIDEQKLVGIPDATVTRQSSRESAIATLAFPSSQPLSVLLPLPEEVRESYLEVREVTSGQVVTVIEILSPKNKRTGEGRIAYERKRQQVLSSTTNFIEIDLLRRGKHFALGLELSAGQYYVLISRGDRRPQADLYSFGLVEPLPSFPLPLDGHSAEPIVELQRIFSELFDRAGFDLVIDYQTPLSPPLTAEEATWSKQLLGNGRNLGI